MRNKFITLAIFILIVLAITGVFLTQKAIFVRQTEKTLPPLKPLSITPREKQVAPERSIFAPLISAHSTPDKAGTEPLPELSSREKIDQTEKNKELFLPEKVPEARLLQSSQSKQVATKFTKIDFNGRVLPDSALQWSCARDTKTGLLWETKLFDAGVSDVEHRYSWYDPASPVQGVKNKGKCYGSDCDTHAYTEEMNRLVLCGSEQWRLPTFPELESLLDRDYFNPVINQEIFFNTKSASYWTQTQLENNPEMIMQIDFFNGTSSPAPIHFKLAVRLVSE